MKTIQNKNIRYKKAWKKAFILLLVICCIPIHAQKDLDRANEYFIKRQYLEALELYIKHEKNTSDPITRQPIFLKIASCYVELRNAEKAASYFSSAIAIRDNLDENQKLSYLNALIETEQYLEAKKYLSSINEIIYFEDVILNTCDFALSNKKIDANIIIEPINTQVSPAIYGIALFNKKLLYIIPELLSKKTKVSSYLYDYESEFSRKFEFKNKALRIHPLFTPSFDQNNNHLYFSRNISVQNEYFESMREELKIGIGGTNNLGIFAVEINTDKNKDKPEILPFINFDYNSTHPFISEDGLTLYFSSDIPGGYGGYDIYYSEKLADGWGRPINMGKNVNTIMNEGYPFVKENKVYFSSTGHPGYGGLDIFKYDIRKEEVSNLGKPLNSSSDDFYYLAIDYQSGFFISNRGRKDGKDVIYNFTIKLP